MKPIKDYDSDPTDHSKPKDAEVWVRRPKTRGGFLAGSSCLCGLIRVY